MHKSINCPSTIFQPDYYSDFRCTADQCPDTCCKGWIIQLDPQTVKNWKNISAPISSPPLSKECLPADLIDTITQRSGEIRYQLHLNEKMHCPLLTEDGLCSMVIAHGHEMTSNICRDYPRHENEYESCLQKYVSIRCSAVVELLWKKACFQYVEAGNPSGNTFPARKLLDGCLSFGNNENVSSPVLLSSVFSSIYKEHKRLEALIPCDASGLRDYGQEMITEGNSEEVLEDLFSRFPSAFQTTCVSSAYGNSASVGKKSDGINSSHLYYDEFFRPYHDFMYDIMQSFFDNPVFGPEFTELFSQSQSLLADADDKLTVLYASGSFLNDSIDKKLKLVLLEELFTAVFSVEVLDYESILVRLQWLIIQYLTIRHILFLDVCHGYELDDARIIHRITRILRVTDLPDILKIAFFDSAFKDWLWTPEKVQRLLLFINALDI